MMSNKWARKPSGAFSKGDMVMSPTYGRGEVLEEWGTFISCRNCFRPLPRVKRGKFGGLVTLCCGDLPLPVSGQNIFDVKFNDGKTRSINACWLTKIETAIAA